MRGVVVCLLLLSAAGPARAAEISAKLRLERARVALGALDYEGAATELEHVRRRLAELSPQEQREALQLSAETALNRERPGEARGYIRELLARVPDFAPDPNRWPPEWRALLEEVRRDLPDKLPPELDVTLPVAVADAPLEVVVTARDRSGVGRVVVHLAGQPPWSLELSSRDGVRWQGSIPFARLAGSKEARLWVEAWDKVGNGPARSGSPAEPLRVVVLVGKRPDPKPPRDTPIYEEWWFWTVLAVGVAGSTVLIYYLATPEEEAAATPSTRIVPELIWPTF